MQEDVEHRTVSLAVSAAKFTGRTLKEAITRFLQHQNTHKKENTATKSGRVTMRQLQKQYGDLRSVTVDDDNTRAFERIARKYHVQYKVFRCEKGKYQIFFKAPNDEAMQSAFREYAAKKIRKADRPPITETLQKMREQIAAAVGERTTRKERER